MVRASEWNVQQLTLLQYTLEFLHVSATATTKAFITIIQHVSHGHTLVLDGTVGTGRGQHCHPVDRLCIAQCHWHR